MHDQDGLPRDACDRPETDGYAVGRHLGDAVELREGREIVLSGPLRQGDDARLAVEIRSRRVEGDVAVRRTAREQKEVDAAGRSEPFLVFARVGRIGNPDVMVGDAGVRRQLAVDRRLDLAKGVAEAAVVRIYGAGDEAALPVRIQILVHHDDDDVREIVIGLRGTAGQRLIGRAQAAPARAAEQEAPSPPECRTHTVEYLAGQSPGELLRTIEDGDGCVHSPAIGLARGGADIDDSDGLGVKPRARDDVLDGTPVCPTSVPHLAATTPVPIRQSFPRPGQAPSSSVRASRIPDPTDNGHLQGTAET